MKQPGFMIYAEDWACYTEDYSDEELGRMLRALLGYFDTQEQPTFSDRGMRQFFKLASKGIDLDRKRYEDKCMHNAYIRYKGICRQQHEKALSFEEWAEEVEHRRQNSPQVTDGHQTSPEVTDGHQTSPEVTDGHQTSPQVTGGHQTSPIPTPVSNTQQSTTNRQQSTTNPQKSKINNKKSALSTNASAAPAFADGPYRPLSENDFEKQREQAIAHLRAIGERYYNAHNASSLTGDSRQSSSP